MAGVAVLQRARAPGGRPKGSKTTAGFVVDVAPIVKAWRAGLSMFEVDDGVKVLPQVRPPRYRGLRGKVEQINRDAGEIGVDLGGSSDSWFHPDEMRKL